MKGILQRPAVPDAGFTGHTAQLITIPDIIAGVEGSRTFENHIMKSILSKRQTMLESGDRSLYLADMH